MFLPWQILKLDDIVWNVVGILFFLELEGILRYLVRKKIEQIEVNSVINSFLDRYYYGIRIKESFDLY